MVDLSCMQVWWEWAPKDGVKPCLRRSAFWRRGNLWDNVGDILSWLFGLETFSAKPIPTAAQQAAPGGTTRAALQVRHCPTQLFCSNCTLTTLLQGIYTGKHSECAGWESLKSTALAYWSRNSYFLPHNYFCFASGLHNSHSKSFGVSQGSLIPKISNHWVFFAPFPWFCWESEPCELYLNGTLSVWQGVLAFSSYWWAETSQCCGQLLPSPGLSIPKKLGHHQ